MKTPLLRFAFAIVPPSAFAFLLSGCNHSALDRTFQPDQLPTTYASPGETAPATTTMPGNTGTTPVQSDAKLVTYLDEQGRKISSTHQAMELFVALSGDVGKLQTDPAARRQFVCAGLEVSDQLADRWFRTQFALDVDTRFSNNTFNVAAGGMTALFGITDASAKAVALLGATTSAVNAQWKNYEASYLISSALPLVLKKLREYRRERRVEIIKRYEIGDAMPDYFEALSDLRSYHQTASREVIKQFIQESAELAELAPKFDADAEVKGLKVIPLNSAVFSVLHSGAAGTFSRNDLVSIQALLSLAKADPLVGAIEGTPAGATLSALVAKALADDERKASLIRSMAGIDSLLDLGETVQQQQKVAAAAAAKAKPAEPTGEATDPEATALADDAKKKTDEQKKAEEAALAAAAAEETAKAELEKKAAAARQAEAQKEELRKKLEGEQIALAEAQARAEAARNANTQLVQLSEATKALAETHAQASQSATRTAADAWIGKKEKTERAAELTKLAESTNAAMALRISEASNALATLRTTEAAEKAARDRLANLQRQLNELVPLTSNVTKEADEQAKSVVAKTNAALALKQEAEKARHGAETARAREVTHRREIAASKNQEQAAAVIEAVNAYKQLPTGSSEPKVRGVK